MSQATAQQGPATTPDRKPSAGFEGCRPLIVLVGYITSTLLYSLALRLTPSSLLVTIPLCMLAFSIPDLMAIVLLKSPHPLMERFLLNLIGPLSSACVLLLLVK